MEGSSKTVDPGARSLDGEARRGLTETTRIWRGAGAAERGGLENR